MIDNEKKGVNNNNEENKSYEDITPIAPPTEIPVTENEMRIDRNEYVWNKVESLEKIINRIYILSIISIFAGIIGFICCCNVGFILNIVVIVLGFIYLSEVGKVTKIGDFSEFDYVRINDLRKKATRIVIFGFLGLIISVLATVLPFLLPFILGGRFYY